METPLKRKRLYGPDVHLIWKGELRLVEKTYRNRPWPVRKTGFLLVWWEAFIYSKLNGIPGIPQVVKSPDAYTLTTTFMGGHNLRDRSNIPDDAYFTHLEELIRNLHSQGVVHLDMRNRRNYGVDDDGMPYLVDFASSIYTPFKGPVWRMLCRIDWMGYLKVKAKLNPALLSSEEIKQNTLGKALSRLWFPSKILPFFRGLFRRG
jgi:hypothetical protein